MADTPPLLTAANGVEKLKAPPSTPHNATFTLDPTVPNLVDISAANVEADLPAASSLAAGTPIVTRVQVGAAILGSTAVTLTPVSGDKINGAVGATKKMRIQGESCTLITDGVSNWIEIAGQLGYSSGQVLYAVVTTANYNTLNRPTTRSDIMVIWLAPDASHLPTNALPGNDLAAVPGS